MTIHSPLTIQYNGDGSRHDVLSVAQLINEDILANISKLLAHKGSLVTEWYRRPTEAAMDAVDKAWMEIYGDFCFCGPFHILAGEDFRDTEGAGKRTSWE